MKLLKTRVFIAYFLLCVIPVGAQVYMEPDTSSDAYALIDSKGYGYEVPDCKHAVRHITAVWNSELKKNVFRFDIHKSLDDDRCINFDRQRCEIKTSASSPSNMKASYGETHGYRWKFKLDAGFQPSANFTHIHQIKAGDGSYDTDNPIITLTPHKLSPNKLEIRFITPVELGGETVQLISVPLSPFLGIWVEAFEKIKYDSNSHGTYSLQLRRLSDDSLLLNYSNTAISMWRTGITFVRPKYGIYRSLNDSNSLRDESVFFTDFYLKEGTSFTLPAAPGNLQAAVLSVNMVRLSWNDNSTTEGLFRIDRSANGQKWNYLATAKANAITYTDTVADSSVHYYYRVRSENTYGNSVYSNTAQAQSSAVEYNVLRGNTTVPKEFLLTQNFPNPFNPSTNIIYHLPLEGNVQVDLYNVSGQHVYNVLRRNQSPGIYTVKIKESQLASGVYFYKLQVTGANGIPLFQDTKKMILAK